MQRWYIKNYMYFHELQWSKIKTYCRCAGEWFFPPSLPEQNQKERNDSDNGKKLSDLTFYGIVEKRILNIMPLIPTLGVQWRGGAWGHLKLERCQFFLDFSITKVLSSKQKTIAVSSYVKFPVNICCI